AEAILLWARPSLNDRRRADESSRADSGDHHRVIVARWIAEPVHGDPVAAAQQLPRGCDLGAEMVRVECDQVGAADPLRIDSPAGSDKAANLRVGQASSRERQAADLKVLDPDPAKPLQDRER